MGSRCFIGVVKNREWKVAKYCNFFYNDPFDEGFEIVEILKTSVDELRKGVDNCYFVDENCISEEEKEDNFYLQSYAGADILNGIIDSNNKIPLIDDSDFFTNYFECMISYIINLDMNRLLVYLDGNLNFVGEYNIYKLPFWEKIRADIDNCRNSEDYISPLMKGPYSFEGFKKHDEIIKKTVAKLQKERGYYFP